MSADHLVVMPAVGEGAGGGWRRLVTGVNPGLKGGYGLDGPFLEASGVYDVPHGAVLIYCDRYAGQWDVRMLVVGADGPEQVKAWVRRSPLGALVFNAVGKVLAENARSHRARRLDPTPNRFNERCQLCPGMVGAGAGLVVRHQHGYLIRHSGQCPQPAGVAAAQWSGLCTDCGVWTVPEDGLLIRAVQARVGQGWQVGRWRLVHRDGCPVAAVPGVPNLVPGWCADCGEYVGAEAGRWSGVLRHHQGCPAPRFPGVATWLVRRAACTTMTVGAVARVSIEAAAGDPGLGTPGWLVVSDRHVEFVAVVLEVATGFDGRPARARVRAATADEAQELLVAELAAELVVPVLERGFKGRWWAPSLGPVDPWVAEITGSHPAWGLQRRFLRPHIDYSRASRSGRGVRFGYTLGPNRVYEAFEPVGWARGGRFRMRLVETRRMFLRTTADGDVQEVGRDEAMALLRTIAARIVS